MQGYAVCSIWTYYGVAWHFMMLSWNYITSNIKVSYSVMVNDPVIKLPWVVFAWYYSIDGCPFQMFSSERYTIFKKQILRFSQFKNFKLVFNWHNFATWHTVWHDQAWHWTIFECHARLCSCSGWAYYGVAWHFLMLS